MMPRVAERYRGVAMDGPIPGWALQVNSVQGSKDMQWARTGGNLSINHASLDYLNQSEGHFKPTGGAVSGEWEIAGVR